MEHTNKDLKFKLSEIERNEREYSRLIEQRRNEIINKIGIGCFQELYAYFKEKYSVRAIQSGVEINDEEQELVQQFINEKLEDPDSEAIYGICKLLALENEVFNCKDAAAELKFRML